MTKTDGDLPLPPDAEDSSLAERARAGLEQARQTAGKAITATRRKGEAVIDDTREKSMRAAAETNRLFLEHPIAAVAAAAAAGAALAIFVPKVAVVGKAGQMAGRAARNAANSDVGRFVLSGLRRQGSAVAKGAAGIAATAALQSVIASDKPEPSGPAADGPPARTDEG